MVECGVYGRNTQQQSEYYSVRDQPQAQHLFGKSSISTTTKPNLAAVQTTRTSGLSAWGIISLIIFVILVGMAGYYGILCYPIVCKPERHYYHMDNASTSSATPTRSSEFEKFDKMGNYSSRSTTPSKSNE